MNLNLALHSSIGAAPSDSVGQYQIVEVISRGNMAMVYKAYQPALDRYVAIKMLSCPYESQFVSRFRREARAIARLQHPNIVPIYDYGEQDDMLYVVLQYIEDAATLADLLEDPIDLVAALRLVYRLLDALSYAHRRGVVHRDIKPANVLMPTPRWPMLADFGIAKLAHESQRLTLAGQTVGTPIYMAPEQAVGGPIDERADLYAVGVVLYEMVTGQVPFDGDAPTIVVAKHMYEAPVPPRELNPALPQAVEAIVLRALAKDPAARYQSAQEMARDLERAAIQLQRQPVSLPSRSHAHALKPEGAEDRVVRMEPARVAEVAARVAEQAQPGVTSEPVPAHRWTEDDVGPALAASRPPLIARAMAGLPGRVELWLAGGSAALMALLLFVILSGASFWSAGSPAAAHLPSVALPTVARPPTATPQLLGIAGDPAAHVLVATMTERPSPSPTPTAMPSPTPPPTQAPAIEAPAIEEPVFEAPTEAPTEVPTEALPAEAPTDPPTEVPTEAPTDPPTEVPTEAPTEVPTEVATEVPTEVATEVPPEAPTEAAPTEPAQATWPLSLVLGMTSTH